MWSLVLREQHRLRIFASGVLRKKWCLREDPTRTGSREMHTEFC